jgi:membrane-bound serine protease (ClpP class)
MYNECKPTGENGENMTDILLNPNVVYLILVAGFFLAILALLSPGTGILEAAALLTLLLAGFAVYNLYNVNNLYINLWAVLILALGVLPFIYAVRKTHHLIYLGISIAALVIGSVFLFHAPGQPWYIPAINPLLALVVSILLGGFLWFATRKVLEAESRPPVHNLEELIGTIGESKTVVNAEGSVQVNGELWSARSNQPIPVGTPVRVVGREGFILTVEPVKEQPRS